MLVLQSITAVLVHFTTPMTWQAYTKLTLNRMQFHFNSSMNFSSCRHLSTLASSSSSPDPENSSVWCRLLRKHAKRATTKIRARMPKPKPKPNARGKFRGLLSPPAHVPQQLSSRSAVMSVLKLLEQTIFDACTAWLHVLLDVCTSVTISASGWKFTFSKLENTKMMMWDNERQISPNRDKSNFNPFVLN